MVHVSINILYELLILLYKIYFLIHFRLANDFEEHSAAALENPIKHLGNPVNAFLLVKRFTVDWENVMNNLIVNNATEGMMT